MNSVTLRFDDQTDIAEVISTLKKLYPDTRVASVKTSHEHMQLKPFTTLPYTMIHPVHLPNPVNYTREELHER